MFGSLSVTATAFNEDTAKIFFGDIGAVYERHKLELKIILVTDETGVTTVQQPWSVTMNSINLQFNFNEFVLVKSWSVLSANLLISS